MWVAPPQGATFGTTTGPRRRSRSSATTHRSGDATGLMSTSADTPWSSSHPATSTRSAPPPASRGAAAAANEAGPPEDALGTKRRIQGIDLARGVAVCLMILSHGVNGLLRFDQFTSWGMVPVHAITKFSSSLFFLVFGVAMAVAFVPKTTAPDWPERRNKLLRRGLVILFWYKVLTIVEMQHLHEAPQIVDALLYRRFPSYVEILGFYAIALLWIPFALPLWRRLPTALRWASPALVALLAWAVARYVPFGSAEPLQALLVEHPDHYTWGQLSRAPLVLAGLLIGELVRSHYHDARRRRWLSFAVMGCGALLLSAFFVAVAPAVDEHLHAVARNAGKHPPELLFMLFSVGGALVLLGLALLGGERAARALRPVTLIGSDALQAFIFHIAIIFLLFRGLLGLFHEVEYGVALTLTLILILATAGWIHFYQALQAAGRRQSRAS